MCTRVHVCICTYIQVMGSNPGLVLRFFLFPVTSQSPVYSMYSVYIILFNISVHLHYFKLS
jgi:hypothetical protein